jgi:hypothetical protein
MAKTRIRITTPFPTVDDVVKTFRIPPARVKKILALVDPFAEDRRRRNGTVRSQAQRSRRSQRTKS